MTDALYSDPALVSVYDVLNTSRTDFDFYLTQLPPPPARVLDLGCGTGSFAIELAQRGYVVTGLDPAAQMIAVARSKPGADAVSWQIGTLDALPATPVFDAVVMTGHAIQCLLTDAAIRTLFHAVRVRLAPAGLFLFETRNPAARAWTRWTPEHAAAPRPLPDGRHVQVIHEVIEQTAEIVRFRESYLFSGAAKPSHSVSTLRFAPMETVCALLADAGLAVERSFGDWNGSPVTSDGPELIFRVVRAHEK